MRKIPKKVKKLKKQKCCESLGGNSGIWNFEERNAVHVEPKLPILMSPS